MKNSNKTMVMALASVCLLMAATGATLITSADESAAVVLGDWTYTSLTGDLAGKARLDAYNGPGGDVTIPSTLDGKTVVGIASGVTLFKNNTALTSVIIPDTFTSIQNGTFNGCTNLTSVTIPNTITSIGSTVFYGCSSLTSLTIPESVTTIGQQTFQGCTNLTSVNIPDGVTVLTSSLFNGCTGLTSITIPSSVITIEQSVFSGCTGLTSVTIPGGGGYMSIDSQAFGGCTGLTSVTMLDGVRTIRGSAFNGCTGLTSVTIPYTVMTLESNAFYKCTNLVTANVFKSKTLTGYEFPTTTEVVRYDIFTISFDSMGGDAIQSIERMTGEEYGDLPVPTREGYQFSGWYYTESDGTITGPVGSGWTAFMDLTLWAKWVQLLDIPYTAPSGNAIATVNWNWTPTTLSGAVVTVSGVDWLSVNGTNVYGVPPSAGEYTITVTITKAGYADLTETFVLTAVSKLVATNNPAGGAIFWL